MKFSQAVVMTAAQMLSKVIPGFQCDPSTGLIGQVNFAVANTPTTMVGDFKNLYEKSGLVNAIPSWFIVQDRFKFDVADSGLGQFYVFGVILQKEQGFTYAPSSGTGSGVVTLNASVSGFIGQAQIEGYAIYLRSRLSYDAAAKASRAGKKAFAQAYGAVLKNMKESHQFRLECSLLYGRDGLGIVSANNGGVLTISTASYSTGTWSGGMTGAVLEAWDATTVTANQVNGDLTISAVSVPNKTITVTGTSGSVVATNILYFKGARTSTAYNECAGLYRVLSNTGSLFNIDAAVYNLWAAQAYVVNGNLSLTAIMQGAALGSNFGLMKAIFLCAPEKFAQLASDEAALRRYVQDTNNTNRGVKGISFMMGAVDIEILPHPLLRQSHGFMLATDSIQRCGATDVTFALPGGGGEKMDVQVTDSTAVEFRSMSDQAIFSDTPAQCVLFTSIS